MENVNGKIERQKQNAVHVRTAEAKRPVFAPFVFTRSGVQRERPANTTCHRRRHRQEQEGSQQGALERNSMPPMPATVRRRRTGCEECALSVSSLDPRLHKLCHFRAAQRLLVEKLQSSNRLRAIRSLGHEAGRVVVEFQHRLYRRDPSSSPRWVHRSFHRLATDAIGNGAAPRGPCARSGAARS